MIPSFLERKIFDEEQPVTVKYLRSLLQLTEKQLAALAQVDIKTIKRAESASNSLQQPTALRLIDAFNSELHKQGFLREEKMLQLHHVAMHVS